MFKRSRVILIWLHRYFCVSDSGESGIHRSNPSPVSVVVKNTYGMIKLFCPLYPLSFLFLFLPYFTIFAWSVVLVIVWEVSENVIMKVGHAVLKIKSSSSNFGLPFVNLCVCNLCICYVSCTSECWGLGNEHCVSTSLSWISVVVVFHWRTTG